MVECPTCEGEGKVIVGLSIFASSPPRPEITTCPDCDGTGEMPDRNHPARVARVASPSSRVSPPANSPQTQEER